MMKSLSCTMLLMLFPIAMISFTGCSEDTAATSMTEGVELSEIEQYEANQRAMEAESEADNEEVAE